MGDKSPKSKQRDQKKRDASVAKDTAAAKVKQDANMRRRSETSDVLPQTEIVRTFPQLYKQRFRRF